MALLLLPGTGLGYALGLRGVAVLVPAAALSSTMISCLASVYPLLGVGWSLLSFIVGATVIVAIVWAVRALVERRVGLVRLRAGTFDLRGLFSGLILWAGLVGYSMIRLVRNPTSIIQSFDNVFHLNVVQYVLDTGQASSLTIAGLTSGGAPPPAYPAAWHGYVALLLGGLRGVEPQAGIGIAVNAATIAVILAGWALGCLLIVQVLCGGRTMLSLLVAGVLGSLYAFPWVFLPEGGLYPNLLGNSLIPGLVAWMLLLLPAGRDAAGRSAPVAFSEPGHRWLGVIALVLALPGVALAHPNSAFTLAVIMVVLFWGRWIGRADTDRRRRLKRLVLLVVATAVLGWAWVRLAPPRPTDPKPPIGLGPATRDLLLGAVAEGGIAGPTLSVLVIVGLLVAIRRRDWPSLLLAGTGALVFVLAIGGPAGEISRLAGALLYNDSERIAAFTVILAVPLVIQTLDALEGAARRWLLDRRAGIGGRVLATVAGTGLLLVLAVPLQLASLQPALQQNSDKLVVLGDRTRRMSRDEYNLIVGMREFVPPGEKVVANPTTGGGFIYALSGVPLVFPHAFVNDSPAMRQLRSQMFNPDQLAATCAAMDQLGAHYFYFPGRFIFHATEGVDSFPGLDEPNLKMLKRVAREGDAKLYRFIACDR